MLHQAAKPFAECTQAELLEHAIARLAAIHGDHGVIAEHLRARLRELDRAAETQRRAGFTQLFPRAGKVRR